MLGLTVLATSFTVIIFPSLFNIIHFSLFSVPTSFYAWFHYLKVTLIFCVNNWILVDKSDDVIVFSNSLFIVEKHITATKSKVSGRIAWLCEKGFLDNDPRGIKDELMKL